MSDILSPSVVQDIEHWKAKFPNKWQQSAVLPVLLLVQKANGGWLSKAHLEAVAQHLRMEYIAVLEVATFYSMLDLKPVGKHKINVCTNVSCMLNGCSKVVNHLKKRLGVSLGETTADNNITLREVECLGACAGAPMMQVNEDYHENLTPEKIDTILDSLAEAPCN